MIKALFDTNLYVGWLREGLHEDLFLGRGLAIHCSAVVLLELQAGVVSRSAQRAVDQLGSTYRKAGRLVAPSAEQLVRTGKVLRRLRQAGREVRRASLVNDVMIALTARELGAVLYTRDLSDFAAIRRIVPFQLTAVTH